MDVRDRSFRYESQDPCELTSLSILIVDSSYRIRHVNQRALDLIGLPLESVVNCHLDEVLKCRCAGDRVQECQSQASCLDDWIKTAVRDTLELGKESQSIEQDLRERETSESNRTYRLSKSRIDIEHEQMALVCVEYDPSEEKSIQTVNIHHDGDAIFNRTPLNRAVIDADRGIILDCTQGVVDLTGYDRMELIGHRLITSQEALHKEGLEQCQAGQIMTKSGATLDVELTTHCFQSGNMNLIVGTIDHPVSEQIRRQERDTTLRLLRLLNDKNSTKELIKGVTLFLQEWMGCEAVGIRLKQGVDYPYYESSGFPPEFLQLENYLCAYHPDDTPMLDEEGNPALECMCGNVICGRFDPTLSFFSERGSFWTNSTTEILKTLSTPSLQNRIRNRCHAEGYESVALIRLRYGDQTVGLLQINDRKPNRFTSEMITFLEQLADQISVAVALRISNAELEDSDRRLRLTVNAANVGLWDWDIETNALKFSPEYLRQIGYEPDELAENFEEWQCRVHPDDIDGVMDYINRYLAAPWPGFRIEYRLRHKNCSYRWILVQASLFLGDNGKPQRMLGCHIDITDRKLTEESLQHTDRMFREAQSIASIGSWEYHPSAHFARWSDEMFRIHGIEPTNEVPTWSQLQAMVNPEDLEQLNAAVDRATQDGLPFRLEYRIIDPQKGDVWVYTIAESEKDASGRMVKISGTVQEINDRKLAEIARDESETRYRQLFHTMSEGFAFCKMIYSSGKPWDFVYLAVNDAFETLTGLQDVVGKPISEVIHGIQESNPELFERFGRVARSAEPDTFEVFIEQLDTWFLVSVNCPFKDHFVVLFQNITERQKTKHDLEDSELRLNEAQKLARLGHYIYDVADDSWTSSETLDDLFGIDSSYPRTFKTWLEIVHPKHRDEMRDYLTIHILKRKKSFDWTYRIRSIDTGEVRWVHGLGRLELNPDGTVARMVGTIQDVTEHMKANREIRKLNETLEQRVSDRTSQLELANKELESFAYSISHDLRAPLRAIDGFSKMLIQDYGSVLDSEANELCASISSNARRMGQLIDDLLAFSRVGRNEIGHAPIDMRALAQATFDDLLSTEPRRRVKFIVSDLPIAHGDPMLIHQVWQNLLSNALKFTGKSSSPVIEVGFESEGHEQIFYVRDNGAGFDMAYVDRLFGVFQRLHKTTEFEGTGVGLAIVQRVIQRHHGRVWAEGEVDRGATIYFSLPTHFLPSS